MSGRSEQPGGLFVSNLIDRLVKSWLILQWNPARDRRNQLLLVYFNSHPCLSSPWPLVSMSVLDWQSAYGADRHRKSSRAVWAHVRQIR